MKETDPLSKRFPPSPPCGCPVCKAYCRRPGWWTVEQAARAMDAGLGPRMMLEMAPEGIFAVLSPAFKGCESGVALAGGDARGCTFLAQDRCQLHATAHMPLECRFCHHSRSGQGPVCHAALEQDWNTPAGQRLVTRWIALTRLALTMNPPR